MARFVRIRHRGSFRPLEQFLHKARIKDYKSILAPYGQMGVDALMTATPIESGLTAASWSYEVLNTSRGVRIVWKNSNRQNGINIAIILHYGHATGGGGYVRGKRYISPAIKQTFDSISKEVWKEVRK